MVKKSLKRKRQVDEPNVAPVDDKVIIPPTRMSDEPLTKKVNLKTRCI